MQNNNLIEATGVLMQNSISEISANSKYFIFVTHLSQNKVSDLFGSKFMENVADIITFEPYSDAEIAEIARRILTALNIRCKNHLSAVITYSDEFVPVSYTHLDVYKRQVPKRSVLLGFLRMPFKGNDDNTPIGENRHIVNNRQVICVDVELGLRFEIKAVLMQESCIYDIVTRPTVYLHGIEYQALTRLRYIHEAHSGKPCKDVYKRQVVRVYFFDIFMSSSVFLIEGDWG